MRATVPASKSAWLIKRQEVAKNVLAKIGTKTVDKDGKEYVVAESLRRKIAAYLLTHPDQELPGPIGFISMEEWQSIPPHPIQRPTARRYNKCREKFAVVTRSQKTVYFIVEDNGDIYMVEGHTRTYGWQNELIKDPATIPEVLNAVIHFVTDLDEGKSEYKTFDDTTQVKTGQENLNSACSDIGLTLTPGGFVDRGVNLVDALRVSFTMLAQNSLINRSMLKRATETPNLKKACKPTIEECVKRFRPAIVALDRLNPPSSVFSSAVTRAFLLAYTKYVTLKFGDSEDEHKLMEFFTKYRDGIGTEKDGKFTSVQNFRNVNNEDGGGEKQRKDKIPRLLGAIERYIENNPDKMYSCDGSVDLDLYFKNRTALTKGNAARKKKTR